MKHNFFTTQFRDESGTKIWSRTVYNECYELMELIRLLDVNEIEFINGLD